MVTETRLPHAAGTDMESGRASVGIGPVCLAASTWGSLVQLQEAVRNARTVSLLARPNRITPPFSRHERSYRPIASMLHGIGVRKNGIVTMKPAYLADAVFRATAAFTSALKARASTFSPSGMSIALRVLPSKLELKMRDGSGRLAPRRVGHPGRRLPLRHGNEVGADT